MNGKQTFFQKLQSADDRTKRRIMIVSTAVVLVVVIYVWLAYFNNLLASFNAPSGPPAGGRESLGFSFLETAKRGLAAVYESVGGLFRSSKDYLITPDQ